MKQFSGVYTALVTPFKDDQIDFDSLDRLLSHQMSGGVDGLVVLGTTGESPTLTNDEKEKVFSFVKEKTAGQLPLVVGTGCNSTVKTIETTNRYFDLGADAALVVVPYYNKPDQRGLTKHYSQLADQAKGPCLLYNVPARTVVGLEMDTIVQLSRHSNIVGIKEASGNIDFGRELRQQTDKGFVITSGDDDSFIELCAVGGDGVISVMSNLLPEKTKNLCRLAKENPEQARSEYKNWGSLMKLLGAKTNPMPIKAALAARDIISRRDLRLPLVEAETELFEKIKTELKGF
jgi:4-hydroxy-tetrahydrodipicolinate synthase